VAGSTPSAIFLKKRSSVPRITVSHRNISVFLRMSRKRWTPQPEITESLLKFREKRKWQIALRRYVLERNKCTFYAPYFGLDIQGFREWIEIQFDSDTNWENFSTAWQFDHIVPVNYFDFAVEEDLRLCWNFINIRVEKSQHNKNRGTRIDVIAAKSYFENLHRVTGNAFCKQMIDKISRIEVSEILASDQLTNFILERSERISLFSTFSAYEFEKLNSGMNLDKVKWEAEFLKKFEE